MNLYCVVCENGDFFIGAKELILALPLDKTINNRFTSENPASDLYKLEVFKKGSHQECNQYLNDIDEKIRDKFKVLLVDEDSKKLI